VQEAFLYFVCCRSIYVWLNSCRGILIFSIWSEQFLLGKEKNSNSNLLVLRMELEPEKLSLEVGVSRSQVVCRVGWGHLLASVVWACRVCCGQPRFGFGQLAAVGGVSVVYGGVFLVVWLFFSIVVYFSVVIDIRSICGIIVCFLI